MIVEGKGMPKISEKLSASSTASNESRKSVRHSSGSVASTLNTFFRVDMTSSWIPALVCLTGISFESSAISAMTSVLDIKLHSTTLPARCLSLVDASVMDRITDSNVNTQTSGCSNPTPILFNFLTIFVLRVAIPKVSQGPH